MRLISSAHPNCFSPAHSAKHVMSDSSSAPKGNVSSASSERYRALFSSARDAIFLFEGSRCIECNPAALEMFGAALDDIIGRAPSQFSPDLQPDGRQSADAAQDRMKAALAGKPQLFEWRHLRKDGSPFHAEVSLSRVDVGGRFLLQAIVRDVTARKQTEGALHAEKDLCERLVKLSPTFLVAIAPDLKTVLVNDTMLSALGYRSEEVVGKDYLETFVPESERPPLAALFATIVAREKALPFENHVVTKDGREILCEWHTIPVFSHGHYDFWVGSGIDITEAKRAAEARDAALKAREEFLAVAAHELRTPLTPLKIQLAAMKRLCDEIAPSHPKAQRLAKALVTTNRQVERLTTLVNDLLDASLSTRAHLTLRPEECDLSALVHEVIEQHAERLANARCDVQMDADADLKGHWDKSRVQQVVENVLTNAMKFGAGNPIEIRIERAEGRARMSVRDHGIGIAKEDQERIFACFERAVSLRHFGGLGLGLYLTRRIAHAHGGSIRVESDGPGRGATFIVELPLR
jgi:PAS domain S-box-containing protein